MSRPLFEITTSSAVLSGCETYRYRLDRTVQPEGIIYAYFGINPSTADALAEDSTTKKWRGFTLRKGGRKYIAGNPFAYRTKSVGVLALAADPIGPDNVRHLAEIIADADILVPCWGSLIKIPRALRPTVEALKAMLLASGKPVMTFGFTASGDPMHPLMLGYDTRLVEFAPSTSLSGATGGKQ